jgi:hypothetical protein
MRPPYKRDLIRAGYSYSYASFMHPNPRFYKYYWWVFTLESEREGRDFLDKTPPLSTAAYIKVLEEVNRKGGICIIYNRHKPRRFDGMPFDPESDRWRDAEWAPAFEDDPDPEWAGFK